MSLGTLVLAHAEHCAWAMPGPHDHTHERTQKVTEPALHKGFPWSDSGLMSVSPVCEGHLVLASFTGHD